MMAWHKKARRLRKKGASLSMIGAACGVSPQAVSLALDPSKRAARQRYVKKWKRARYKKDERFRKRQQKLDRESKRRQRAVDAR